MRRTYGHPIDELVGQNLLRIRKAKGFSQPVLGAAVGISFPQIQKYETGVNPISTSTLYRLALVLHIGTEDLFVGVDIARRQQASVPEKFKLPAPLFNRRS